MFYNFYFLICSICVGLPLALSASEFQPVWNPNQLTQVPSFDSDEKIVGTHYFYWYQYPNHHFFDDGQQQDDALQDHFPNPEMVSFNSVEWHKQELRDCIDAGIDFIMPVYWGVVDNYFKPDIVFSIQGLGPLQRAMQELEQEGFDAPKVGLFYDTSTLLPGVRGDVKNNEKYDLRDEEGKDIFYRTIRDFFYQIEPKYWATLSGKPIVVLYGSAFAAYHDQSTFDYVYTHFENDFHGIKPYIVRDNSWNANTEAVTSWGAALGGPNIFDKVAQIGPGYNDSAVPGRSTPIRDRESGNFYRWGWNKILKSDVHIVLIETWNEMHEGTTICHSVEYGRDYIEMTRYYVEKFKANSEPVADIDLEHPNPLPRPASNRGSEYADQDSVLINFEKNEQEGIYLVKGQTDGQVKVSEHDNVNCIQSIDAGNTYIYFDIADPFAFDHEGKIKIEYTYFDAGHDTHFIQYDSHDTSATLSGAYKSAPAVGISNQNQWVSNQIVFNEARFVNRQNGGADFRFAVLGGSLAIRDIKVSKLNSVNNQELGY